MSEAVAVACDPASRGATPSGAPPAAPHAMSSFDPKAAFQAEFERIKLAASRRQPAKEKEKLKPLLLS